MPSTMRPRRHPSRRDDDDGRRPPRVSRASATAALLLLLLPLLIPNVAASSSSIRDDTRVVDGRRPRRPTDDARRRRRRRRDRERQGVETEVVETEVAETEGGTETEGTETEVVETEGAETEVVETEVAAISSFVPDPNAPVTFCLGGCKGDNEKCVGNQNHPQGITDDICTACESGQTFWPCDTEGLCFCWDQDKPRIPPAPGSGLALQSDAQRPCDFFTESIFKTLAPEAKHPYTYEGLCSAIDNYNEGHAEKIFMMGTEEERKSEFAAFLGNTLHESDEWKAGREYLICGDNKDVGGEVFCKPCDSESFDWETFTCNGPGLAGGGLTYNGYCDYTIMPPIACPCDGELVSEPEGDLAGYIPASKVFFGRGAIQLSWNYNFRAASEALTGDAATFCDDPDLVAVTPEYAWGAGIFFWMENLKEETTCHIEALRNSDFGGTLNNINGGLECPAYHGGWHAEAVKMRLNRYCKASSALGLETILIFDGCKGLNTSFAECLGDGTCPECDKFSDAVAQIVAPSTDTEDSSGGTEGEGAETEDTETEGAETEDIETEGAETEDTETEGAETEDIETEGAETEDTETEDTEIDDTETEDTETEDTETGGAETEGTEIDDTETKDTETEDTEIEDTETEGTETAGAVESEAEQTKSPSSAVTTQPDSPVASLGTTSEENDGDVGDDDSCPGDLFPVDGLPGCCVPEPLYHGDGACDPDAPLNTAECAFDGGDCCRETCDLAGSYACSSVPSEYGPFGFFCTNPTVDEYIDPELCTVSDRRKIGDGRCDSGVEMYNSDACNWDGGDCCVESCDDQYAHFDCGSPDYPYDCQNPDFADTASSSNTLQPVANEEEEDLPLSTVTTQTNAPLAAPISSVGVTNPTSHGPIVLIPSDDATIVEDHPDENYGNESTLQVDDDSGTYDSLIQFDLSDIDTNSVVSATLRLFCTDGAEAGGIFGKTVDSNWDEGSVTWNSAPKAFGAPFHSLGNVQEATWYDIDVTNAFFGTHNSPNAVSIRITSKSWNRAGYSSKEGSDPPQLVIQMKGQDPTVAESTPLGTECPSDTQLCPDGSVVSRVLEDGCNFSSCPHQADSGTGLFFPVWRSGGVVACVDRASPPSWASGAYLKESKSDCCEAYSMLRVEECLQD